MSNIQDKELAQAIINTYWQIAKPKGIDIKVFAAKINKWFPELYASATEGWSGDHQNVFYEFCK